VLGLRDAAKCRGNVLVVQVQPGKASECLGVLVFQAFAGNFGIFSVVGVKGYNNVRFVAGSWMADSVTISVA
jgi:hypothetical protein